jgi:hypothetical protein
MTKYGIQVSDNAGRLATVQRCEETAILTIMRQVLPALHVP